MSRFLQVFFKIDHDILMSQLLHNHIRGVMQSWLKYCLSNGKQYVSIRNCCSSMSNIALGVPQGMVLGPVFFFYISMTYKFSYHMFFIANDAKVYFHLTGFMTKSTFAFGIINLSCQSQQGTDLKLITCSW